MERWDILDINGEKTGRMIERGKPLKSGEYHLVVDCWLMDSCGRFLITRRSPEKTYAGLWEPTTGSAVAGEDSFSAVVRENLEETGIVINKDNAVLIGRYRHDGAKYFRDVYLVRQDFKDEDVILQKGETDAFMRADREKVLKMIEEGSFLPKDIMFYIDDFFSHLCDC
ncbi:MAG: NUDIX domain-containing protein [Christensenellaceae bacterium]|nr:NUDIX domain-containing protein [Christensenellaceae bacterium]